MEQLNIARSLNSNRPPELAELGRLPPNQLEGIDTTMTTPSAEALLLDAIQADEDYTPRSIDESAQESAKRLEAIKRERAIRDAERGAKLLAKRSAAKRSKRS
ncbi:hypothetical protein [Mycobacterium sp. Aquia_213]|uniref:hypothetical protein n=1 Tax=Mycobacterium sp. Aquia_213 TaxID=2991728 RepID=UPI002271AEBC|nr:hypothetical protein [Mycobacterium sp. Aquia_213]WAC90198.1 hypothetical protein LMQ14_20020 [Mycobacterium sp. Aquia_213]